MDRNRPKFEIDHQPINPYNRQKTNRARFLFRFELISWQRAFSVNQTRRLNQATTGRKQNLTPTDSAPGPE